MTFDLSKNNRQGNLAEKQVKKTEIFEWHMN